MSKSILCIVPDAERAEDIVGELLAAGFTNDDLSVLFPDRSGSRDFALEHHTKAPEGAATGAGAGGAIGGTLGWLAGIGLLALPGLGPVLAAGPLLAALSGAAVGAAVGGVAGALIGMGVPEFEAKQYEGKLEAGHILLSVRVVDGVETQRARDILERHGAESISIGRDASVSDPSSRSQEARDKPRGKTVF